MRSVEYWMEFTYVGTDTVQNIVRRPLKGATTEEARAMTASSRFRNRPPWFVPKELVEYEAWFLGTDDDHSAFYIFKDKKTGTFFVHDFL